METLSFNDFSQGWVPTDDPVGGRKNGLLKMDSLTLDKTGVLSMAGGTENIRNDNYPADSHTLYAKNISGTIYHYLALTNGAVYRDGSSLTGSGSTTRAAFGSAYNYVFIASGNYRVKDTGAAISNLGISTPSNAPTLASAGAGSLTGTYEYAEMDVANFNGAYTAKSPLGPTDSITVTAENVTVTAHNFVDGQANEKWIFRRGGNLPSWYRIKRLTSSITTPFTDDTTDDDALDEGVLANTFLTPVNSTGIPDAILEIVGLVKQRMFFFTKNAIYIGEINSPDSYDSRRVLYYAGNGTSGAELFLWARKVGENSILIGTTQDVHVLTGTFETFPDGYIDVQLRSLGIENPPIAICASLYKNNVVYMAADGWRVMSLDGNSTPLCPPITDAIYKGESFLSNYYGGVPIFLYPTLDYQCVVARNKLYVLVPTIVGGNASNPFSSRMEVYDFVRKYWRPLSLTPIKISDREDDIIMGLFNTAGTRNLRVIDSAFVTTIGGSNQTIGLLTLFNDNGNPFNRKTPANLHIRCNTGGSNATLKAYKDGDLTTGFTISTTLNSSSLTTFTFDISSLFNGPFKSISIEITGALANFKLESVSVSFVSHPTQVKYFRVLNLDFGEANGKRKRVHSIPLLIDTLGGNVTATPYIDGTAYDSTTINSSGKLTKLVDILQLASSNVDASGVDYDLILAGNSEFELWQILSPVITRVYPVVTKYKQFGALELFKYGRIKTLEFHIAMYGKGSTLVPTISVLCDDVVLSSPSITVEDNVEKVYSVPITKTVGGGLLRVLIRSSYAIHIFSVRALVSKTGKDTENEWVMLDA